MKKTLAILLGAGLMLSSVPAYAGDDPGDPSNREFAKWFCKTFPSWC